MPRVINWTFSVEEYETNGVLRHRLTWTFYCDDGSEHRGTQDRDPASYADHNAWLSLQASAFTIATAQTIDIAAEVI